MFDRNDRAVRFGLNYTPGEKWYYLWNEWDLSAVERDFDAVAALGIDHLRVQLIWAWFQPNPIYVSPGHLQRLSELMAAARSRDLDVCVSVLTGPLSGYVFLPPYVKRDRFFTDPDVIEAQKLGLRKVLDVVADAPNLMAVDLGNELNCLCPLLETDAGDAWGRAMVDTVREHAPQMKVVNGIDHMPVVLGNTFSMQHLTEDYDAISLHTWPRFSGCLERGEVDDAPSVHFPAFCTQMVRLFERSGRKPVWLQEYGTCDLWGSQQAREAFMRESTRLALEEGARILTWWCSHDKNDSIRFNKFEYRYGLLTPEGKPKPLARVYSELIEQYAASPPETPQADCLIAVDETFRPAEKPDPPRNWVHRSLNTTTWDLFDTYLAAVARDERPRLIRRDQAGRTPAATGARVSSYPDS